MRRFRRSLELVGHLARREFRLRYTGSLLGILWSILVPLARLLVLIFLFQKVVPLEIEAYPAYVFCALLPWNWFSTSLGGACNLFIGNRDLLFRPNFVPSLLPTISMLSNLMSFLVSLPILLGFLLLYHIDISVNLLLLPVLLLIQGLLIIGLSFMIATLNVFYRDVQHLINIALSLLFYLTPVFYRAHLVEAKYKFIFLFNPMAILIEGYRAIFMDASAPLWDSLLLVTVMSLVICAGGISVYRSQRQNIMDAI